FLRSLASADWQTLFLKSRGSRSRLEVLLPDLRFMSRSSTVRNDMDESLNSRNQSNDVFRPPNIWTIVVEHPLWIIGFSFFAFILLINIPSNLVPSPFRKPAPDAKTTQNSERVTRAAVGAATHPDQVLFDRAKEAMRRKRFDIANLELQTLLNTYPSSKFA